MVRSLLFSKACVVVLIGLILTAASDQAAAQTPPISPVGWVAPIYSTPAGPARNLANRASTFDASGNAYVAFEVEGEFVVGDSILRNGSHNGVVRYTPTGQATWVRNFGPNAHITGLAADRSGNVVAAGWFDGPITLDNQVLQPQGSDIFLVKWNAAGQMLWARQGLAGGSPATRRVSQLAVDARGDIYIAGTADGQAAFGAAALVGSPVLLTSEVSGAAYCARYTATGDLVWVTGSDNHGLFPSGLSRTTNVTGLGTDAAGHVYLTGVLPGQFRWGAGAPPLGDSTNLQKFYWLRLDAANGQYQTGFSERMDAAGGARLAVDSTGNSYLVQQLLASAQLNGMPLVVPSVPGSTFASAVYIACLNSGGLPQWAQVLTKTASVTMLNVAGIAVNDQQRVAIALTYAGDTLVVGTVGLGRHWTAVPTMAVFDAQTGTPQQTQLLATGTPGFHQAQTINIDPSGQVLLTGSYITDSARFGALSAATPGAQPHRGKLFAALLRPGGTVLGVPNFVAGIVYLDANANGRRDTMEVLAPAGIVLALSDVGPYAVTDSAGRYRLEFGIGTFNLVFAALPANYQAAPVLLGPLVAYGLGRFAITQRTPLVPIALRPDGRLTLTAYTDAEPGLPLRYRLTLENTGTVPTVGGSVTLDFDARLTYAGASLPGATVVGRRLSAPAPVLLPGERRSFDLTFQVPTTAPLASVLTCAATLALPNDSAPADNTSAAPRPVVAARLPMTAEVDHSTLTLPQVAAHEWLTYTVRFRNGGTAPAADVAIANALPAAQVRLGSVQVLAASHPFTWAVRNNTVAFELRGANLPPFAQNTVASMGFVTFRVRVQDGLPAGTAISLTSTVGLTGQAPVALTALTRVGGVTGRAEAGAVVTGATVWPNPARETLFVEVPTAETLQIALFDGVGRVVRTASMPATARQFDVRGLPAGVYTLRATGSGGAFTRRVTVLAAE